MHKIVQVIFSTNRLEYLIPTLKSTKNLNYYGCKVHRIVIDDYPRTRNDNLFVELCKLFDIDEVILNQENKGLSKTWTDFYKILTQRDYDYIFHLEDDVKILEPVLVTDLIELLKNDNTISQLQLSKNAWYFHETDHAAQDEDIVYKNFRYMKCSTIFSPMASICSKSVAHLPITDEYNSNLNEGIIGQYFYNRGQVSAIVKNYHGKNIVEHIGEWFTGKRLIPGDNGYDQFSHYDPNQKYYSRDGKIYK
jgi:hypothetical protein